MRIRLGSNTTIVGLGEKARLRGAWLDIRGTAGVANSRTNIIIRNLTFQDTFDCFPAWAPTDGALGSWNSLYDSISLRDTNNVWIDHNTFEDATTADETLPQYFGVLFQVHDGLVDITNASDLVTVSWNRFRNHDKTMLIGSSDSAAADRGKLRVTFHHNLFDGVGQRAPRVRFGQVHVYNNYYKDRAAAGLRVQLGRRRRVGDLRAEQLLQDRPQRHARSAHRPLQRHGDLRRGHARERHARAQSGRRGRGLERRERSGPRLDAGWTPTLNFELLPAWTTPLLVPLFAGPFRW